MSLQGDIGFLSRYRTKLQEVIEAEKQTLVGVTTERKAGYIQGLQTAFDIADETFRQLTGDPPQDKNGNR